jgi:hypothetical protein
VTTEQDRIADYLEGGATALADGVLTWTRNTLGSDGFACAYGACNFAQYKTTEPLNQARYPYATALAPVLLALYGVNAIPAYNDDIAETVDDVVDMLRTVAKEIRNK